MLKELQLRIKNLPQRERLVIIFSLVLVVATSLWIVQNPPPNSSQVSQNEGEAELGLSIPKGFVVIPIELANARTLASMVNHQAVINLFEKNQTQPVVENLKIIKLETGNGQLFGALVPDKWAPSLQTLFGRPTMTAGIRPVNSGELHIHAIRTARPLLTEVGVDGNNN